MASVYKPNHSKTFRVGYYDQLTGTKKSVSAKTTDRTKANRFAKDFEARQRIKRFESDFDHPADHRVKISEAAKLYYAQKEFSPETIRGLKSIINLFTNAIGDKYLFQISRYDFYDFINTLTKRNASVNTKAIYSRHLFAMFNWLIKEKFINSNPITKTRAELKEVKPIPPDDLEIIFDKLQNKKERFIHHYYLIKLTFLCAFRISESLRSEAEDFDVKNKMILIRNNKGKRIDNIPMVIDIENFITNEMNIKERTGRLFNYATRDSVKTFWLKLNDDLKFDYTIHQLRKTRGTQLANAGVEPLFLQKFMRHKEFRTTQSYYIKLDMAKMAADINSKLNLNHNLNHKSGNQKPRQAKCKHQLASNNLKLAKI